MSLCWLPTGSCQDIPAQPHNGNGQCDSNKLHSHMAHCTKVLGQIPPFIGSLKNLMASTIQDRVSGTTSTQIHTYSMYRIIVHTYLFRHTNLCIHVCTVCTYMNCCMCFTLTLQTNFTCPKGQTWYRHWLSRPPGRVLMNMQLVCGVYACINILWCVYACVCVCA